MPTSPETEQQLQLLRRGAEALYGEGDLRKKLASKRPLRIKLGMDPTAPDIHLGHTVVLRKLRQFQDLGHVAVLIIGDYTAKIGDPTGRDTTRPVLDDATIKTNAQTYLEQAGKILDTTPGKIEVRHNSEWLAKLTFADVLRLTGMVTVQQMLHRENFANRMTAGKEIQLSEFMYPIMQAYDSVVVKSDVELGGTDQTFNNLMGRALMTKHDMHPQVVLVMPILTGLDGREKMSKSKGNYVAVNDPPDQMFGKVMSIPDTLMPNYFQLLTALPQDRVSSLLNPGETHPRDAKDILARIIVEGFYSADAGVKAADEFRRRFAEDQLPSDMELHEIEPAEQTVVNLIKLVNFAPSSGEAKRLIQQGAVSFDGAKVGDVAAKVTVPADRPAVLMVGKRRVCQVKAK
jgi:tyrosyl-tRNA synthetase